jgi:glycerol kinase
MEFIVERLALEQDFLEALGLSSESIRLPSVAGIVEPFWSMVSRGTISTIGQMTNLLLLRNS